MPHEIVKEFPVEICVTETYNPEIEDDHSVFSIGTAGKYKLALLRKQPHFFGVYDSAFCKVGEICLKGRGPDEFIAPMYYNQYCCENGEVKVWILDRAMHMFVQINVDKSIGTGRTVIEKRYNLSRIGSLSSVRNIFFVNDNLLIGTSDEADCKIFLLNPNDASISYVEHVMPFPLNHTTHDYSQNMCAIKPDRSKIVSAFFNLPQINFIDRTGEIYHSTFYKTILDPKYAETEEAIDFYLDICATDKYIYALAENPEDTYRERNNVYVFDWHGTPVANINIPYATSLAADNDNIYTVNFDREKELVSVINLRDLPSFE